VLGNTWLIIADIELVHLVGHAGTGDTVQHVVAIVSKDVLTNSHSITLNVALVTEPWCELQDQVVSAKGEAITGGETRWQHDNMLQLNMSVQNLC
jgi:hypothetical protein